MKTRNPMKTEYIIKTAELNAGENRPAYIVFSVNEDGKQTLAGRYWSLSLAAEAVRRMKPAETAAPAETRDRKAETGASEVEDFLKDHPELAQALSSAAKGYAEEKRRAEALKGRRRELGETIAELDKAICRARQKINSLKGETLRLQKARKAAFAELQSVVRQIGAGK